MESEDGGVRVTAHVAGSNTAAVTLFRGKILKKVRGEIEILSRLVTQSCKKTCVR